MSSTSRYVKLCIEEVLLKWERERGAGSGEVFSQRDLQWLVNSITKQVYDDEKRKGYIAEANHRRQQTYNGGRDWQ